MFYSILSNFSYLIISYFETLFIYEHLQIESKYINNDICKVFLAALSGYTTVSFIGLLLDINYYYNHNFLKIFKIQTKHVYLKNYIILILTKYTLKMNFYLLFIVFYSLNSGFISHIDYYTPNIYIKVYINFTIYINTQ